MYMTCEFFSKLNNEYRVNKSSIKSFKKKKFSHKEALKTNPL